MHFTPLIRKPRCPTPTRKFRYGYVKSTEKKTLNRIIPLLLGKKQRCALDMARAANGQDFGRAAEVEREGR